MPRLKSRRSFDSAVPPRTWPTHYGPVSNPCPRDVPEPQSIVNDRHQQQPANMKLGRALNPRATHENTLVMRRSGEKLPVLPRVMNPQGRSARSRPRQETTSTKAMSASPPAAKHLGRGHLQDARAAVACSWMYLRCGRRSSGPELGHPSAQVQLQRTANQQVSDRGTSHGQIVAQDIPGV